MKILTNTKILAHRNSVVHFYNELPKDRTDRQPYLYFKSGENPQGVWGIQTSEALEESGWEQKRTVEEL